MKTLTNESKARFFAQYWGQQILCWESEIAKHKYMIVGYRIKNDIAGYYLELTPLQNISDEHADDCARINCTTGEYIRFLIRRKNEWQLTPFQYQYLQSKCYALEYYCPIENRIIPVKEQIDNGWITLKTE